MYEGKRIRIDLLPPKTIQKREPLKQQEPTSSSEATQNKALQLITPKELEREAKEGTLMWAIVIKEATVDAPHEHSEEVEDILKEFQDVFVVPMSVL